MSKYYQGIYKPKNPQKYEGDPTQIIYRSSWELKFFNWCDNNPSVVGWCSEEIIVPYVCPTDGKPHRYFPDARIKVRNRTGQVEIYLVEIKPDKQTRPPEVPKRKTKRFLIEAATYMKNEAKWKAAKRYADDRGWRFMIITENHLGLTK